VRVGVVGLGLAGLRAATLLQRSGLEVVAFDARPRVGGRLHTVETEAGPSHEAGAQWIDGDHRRLIGLLGELGLAPLAKPDGPGLAIHRGERTRDDELWEDAARDEAGVEALAARLCREIGTPPRPDSRNEALDRRDLAGFFDEHARSGRGRWWLEAKYRSDEGDDLSRVGLLGWLVGYQLYVDRAGEEPCALRLPVPARELCARLAADLRTPPRLGHVLRAVERDSRGATLAFEAPGGSCRERFDEVVLTLPPSCLSRVDFRPELPSPQRAAHRSTRMGRAVKIVWEFERAFWRDEGWNGTLAWDGPLQATWDGTLGGTPALCAYVCGRQAEEWAARRDPVREGLELLAGLFPAASPTFRRGFFHDWTSDPFSLGVHSHLQPGYVLAHQPHVARPAGPLHFAGEHTATWTGFLEGALESAERVAAELGATASSGRAA
jgi:monoamine oxidase